MSNLDELLTSARAALQAGDTLVARGYLRRAARLAPDRLDIWTDLWRVSERPEDRIECLERIVELDPNNAEAQRELDHLRADALRADALRADALRAEHPQADASHGDERSEGQGMPVEPGAPYPETRQERAQADPSLPQTSGIRLDITDEMRQQWAEAVAAGEPLFCIDHPHRETVLRCNQCDAPVCTDCVVRTPVGFRCKECIKAQQAAFFNTVWYDYPLAALVALILSVPAAVVTSLAGWWFALIISPFAGGLIGGAVHWAIGRRRGRGIWLVVAICVVLGAFVATITRPSAIVPIGIYAVMATGAAVGALRLRRRR
jgi:hypothetical protein